MKKFKSKSEAFASQKFNPEDVIITGVPERHLKAAHAFINLCIAHDAVNPEFIPDYSNDDQRKYENWFEMGSPSGAGFAYDDYGPGVRVRVSGRALFLNRVKQVNIWQKYVMKTIKK